MLRDHRDRQCYTTGESRGVRRSNSTKQCALSRPAVSRSWPMSNQATRNGVCATARPPLAARCGGTVCRHEAAPRAPERFLRCNGTSPCPAVRVRAPHHPTLVRPPRGGAGAQPAATPRRSRLTTSRGPPTRAYRCRRHVRPTSLSKCCSWQRGERSAAGVPPHPRALGTPRSPPVAERLRIRQSALTAATDCVSGNPRSSPARPVALRDSAVYASPVPARSVRKRARGQTSTSKIHLQHAAGEKQQRVQARVRRVVGRFEKRT